ncbi:1-(5-phosphoribosyl)-5-[(5-phosphoribosylamino)methylideneamino]imidazole-4-carboxamide isomerase [Desulfurobacterium atlanticum]|uniref:1-(5-phosphoribosyl)-5-[(5-phosphoribosylamino)methylideneamino] imidazole-4-carboxamide isomerase n=1 Tax=Desulfurobacterium atlanticum TaxID=240169 RepID=A0A238ZDJ8_9BACT|nr:1-(5-phosphoribosyl)-5-[(5-phosphoribosylamino)methylideneamino]imidazole-4-carboxamide isomerase [Desulfurobacterium atlanticum]SNR81595.1 1-(5-phosphoribosyl)-5-[(5-phosphoribosylamino)methylideneamino] imidazole-4-carboxamide isomerase [Desulfurobacterium atlanticum]
MFELIPAVDIKDGKCVRLYKGRADAVKEYFDNPVEAALLWQNKGATRLHVVDLDGAFEGVPKNIKIVEEIVKRLSIPVQFGGGVRTVEAVKALKDAGVDRIIVGTVAVENPELFEEMIDVFPDGMVLGVDAKDGYMTTRGWVEKTELKAVEFAKKYEDEPIWGFVYTDISRDGTLEGPNFEEVERFAGSVKKPVIASGGIAREEDVFRLAEIPNVVGAITGKAVYEGTIDFESVVKRLEKKG